MEDDIQYSTTLDGVQVRFPRNVGVDGTKWGTRIQLTDDEALLLHTRLEQYLGMVPCTCSKLSAESDHRCLMHPGNRALTFDERMEFEQSFDANLLTKTEEGL